MKYFMIFIFIATFAFIFCDSIDGSGDMIGIIVNNTDYRLIVYYPFTSTNNIPPSIELDPGEFTPSYKLQTGNVYTVIAFYKDSFTNESEDSTNLVNMVFYSNTMSINGTSGDATNNGIPYDWLILYSTNTTIYY